MRGVYTIEKSYIGEGVTIRDPEGKQLGPDGRFPPEQAADIVFGLNRIRKLRQREAERAERRLRENMGS